MRRSGDAELGRALRKCREEAGLSLEALAERVKKSASFLFYVEHGERLLTLPLLRSLLAALGVPLTPWLVRDWLRSGPAEVLAPSEACPHRQDLLAAMVYAWEKIDTTVAGKLIDTLKRAGLVPSDHGLETRASPPAAKAGAVQAS